jgi:hypothetical protein
MIIEKYNKMEGERKRERGKKYKLTEIFLFFLYCCKFFIYLKKYKQ